MSVCHVYILRVCDRMPRVHGRCLRGCLLVVCPGYSLYLGDGTAVRTIRAVTLRSTFADQTLFSRTHCILTPGQPVKP